MSFSIRNGQSEVKGDFSKLERLVKDLGKKHYTDIGVFDTAKYDDGTPVAQVGAAHEFGMLINHPGGTPYKIGADGKAIFIKKGTPGAVGVTRPHTIKMPERSFIRMPLQEKSGDIEKSVKKNAKKHLEDGDVKAIFEDIGFAGEAVIQEAFDSGGFGTWPKDKTATAKRKGSDSVLIDTGTHGGLRGAITHRVG